ncbi:MAG TPA: hypothetical protein VKQ72_15705 [Aggregatilineales bacterium]|nr:hypothetical protein [Aggregatilineales bacterium]
MTKTADYRKQLRETEDWDTFLMAESGLPGPRGNLALADAAADEGDPTRFAHWLTYTAETAPTNTPGEFLALCGAVGLGRLLAEGHRDVLPKLRECASDARWRMREGVAIALQRWGDVDMSALVEEMQKWSQGNLLEQRAAAAAVCEPRLLKNPAHAEQVFQILDTVTASIAQESNRKSEAFIALRKGLAYCWSVAVAAYPGVGKSHFERWLESNDKDIRSILRENLKKDRLSRMDAAWVERAQTRLDSA